MDISSVNSDLIRGNVTTIILGSLWNTDRYGYDILKEIEMRSGGQYNLKQPTLYNQLKRLEKQGLISSYDGAPDDTGGGRRRYYSLTAEGRAFLQKEKTEYEYSRTILDRLVSPHEFDFDKTPVPFNAEELRPYSKKEGSDEKAKVVYKDKVVEVEKVVEIEVEKVVEVEKLVEVERIVPVEIEKIIERTVYLDAYGNEITKEEAEEIARQAMIEAERQKELKNRPAVSLNDIFAQLDAKSEYEAREKAEAEAEAARAASQKVEPVYVDEATYNQVRNSMSSKQETVDEHTYFNAYAGEHETRTRSQSTLKEIFERLEKQEAEIDEKETAKSIEKAQNEETEKFDSAAADVQAMQWNSAPAYYDESSKYNRDNRHDERENAHLSAEIQRQGARAPIYSEADKGQFVTSAVISKRDETFEFEKEHVNYRDFFSSIASLPEDKPETEVKERKLPSTADADLKSRLYADGYKIRPYDKGNTSEFYSFNFIQSNRISRDAWLIVFAMFVLEIAVMWLSLSTRIDWKYFLPILLIGGALLLVPTVIYFINPSKRVRANFNFKLSLINRGMLFIELTVVAILIGFFAVGASVNDTDKILMSIVLPMVLLTNLPLSSIAYMLLYRTKRYHVA